jgi:hypothetical protein
MKTPLITLMLLLTLAVATRAQERGLGLDYNPDTLKIFRTREQVGRFSTPVIIGVQVTRKFMRLTTADDYYRPEGEVLGLHAMTVVGYDATSFKILTSSYASELSASQTSLGGGVFTHALLGGLKGAADQHPQLHGNYQTNALVGMVPSSYNYPSDR